MTEHWKPVPGYESLYAVSGLGAIKSVRNGRHMAPVLNSHGYETVKLHRAGIGTRFRVHRLVCEAFHASGDPSSDVAHLDGNRRNNRADNFAWTSRAENEAHKKAHGTKAKGPRNGRAKLTQDEAESIRAMWKSGLSASFIGRAFNVHPSTAHRVATAQRYRSDDSAAIAQDTLPTPTQCARMPVDRNGESNDQQ